MAGLIYLLARILFRRREVGVLVGIFALADGMLFVQSRIGMNDAYVGLGIVAAYALFAAIWTGAWRWRGAFWVAMPVIGVFLGLALASKWVALYAIGGLGILVLVRSALGRLILIAALIAMTAVLGHLALAVPANSGLGNLPFVAIMVGLTAVAVVVNILHPIAWSDDEMRFAVGAPAALGGIIALAAIGLGQAGTQLVDVPLPQIASEVSLVLTPLHVAAALVVLSLVIYGSFVLAGRAGFGPFAPPPDPTDPAALLPPPAPPTRADWLRPGALLGLPIAWMAVCLLVIPLGLYVASYIPWAFVEGHRITATWPPGHEGQTLIDLTRQMYDYHNNLTDGHAASSPWWAWPFDLKPVWFYQEGFAGSTTAAIYDSGNLVIWWLGVPALAFVAWQAYARRSLALALIVIAFACQWISWVRIDRPAFQYHYYTSLPFVILALAYFAAELWHGTSRRIWLLARVSAGVAVMGPALLWLFDRPLCAFVGVERAVPNSQVCPPLIPEFVLTAQTLVLGVVVVRRDSRVPAPAVVARHRPRRRRLRRSARPARGHGRRGTPRAAARPARAGDAARDADVDPGRAGGHHLRAAAPAARPVRGDGAGRAAVRDRPRDRRRQLVPCLLPEHLGAAAARRGGQRLPGDPADLPLRVPVPETPGVRGDGVKLIDPIPAILAVALTLLCIVLAYSAWVWRIAHRRAGGRRAGRGGRAGTGGARRLADRFDRPADPSTGTPTTGLIAPAGRGEGGIGAEKPAGSSPRAARRRMTKP